MNGTQPQDLFDRRPSDRFYGRLHWALMAIIAAIVLYGLLLARWLPVPRGVGFRFVILLLLSFNALWWSVADRRIARYVPSSRLALGLRLAIAIFTLSINLPLFQAVYSGRIPPLVISPTWYTAAATFWHVSLPLALPAVAALRLAGLGVIAMTRRTAAPSPSAAAETESFDPTRRALLKTAFASVPVALLTGGAAWSRWREGRFQVNRHTVAAPWLPERLRGLTITHISDLHVGRLYRPYLLPRLIDEANALNSDLVVVTGDIIDNSNEMLPATIDALKQLEHRHGIYLCIGNHDEIDDRDEFIRYTRSHLPLLINERRVLNIGGERLTLVATDYASDPLPSRRRPGDLANVIETLAGYDARSDGPAIALAHHPHTWDVLQLHGVPLTLSGHTHGGQIMLTPPNVRPDLGLGRALFHYISGFYHRDLTTLFVNRGVGNWFPLRINAPAEIAQLQLT